MLGRLDTRKSVVAVVAVALILAIASAVLLTYRRVNTPSSKSFTHPAVAGRACSSCKTRNHRFAHQAPYDAPDCAECHTLTSWTFVTFNHKQPEFSQGFHALIDCAACHRFGAALPDPGCASCHRPGKHPVVASCRECHTPETWRLPKPPPKGHVGLSGGHAALTCFACHIGASAFRVPPRQCLDCHGPKHGGIADCQRCHDPVIGWRLKPEFRHTTAYPLTGRHSRLACKQCHARLSFVGTSAACVSCHGAKHGGLTDCARCHRTSGFLPTTFAHASVWPLTGRHAVLGCSACHLRRLFARHLGDANSCVSCHGRRHGGLSACASCHTTAGFTPSTFDHRDAYPLTGRHKVIACSKCHPGNRYATTIGSPSRCVNCHGIAHGNQSNCSYCHTTAGFSPIKSIVHPVFPRLGGEHAVRPCTLCHPTLRFDVAPRTCSACHTAPHVRPTDCLRCHRPTVWTDLHFTHSDIAYHTGIAYEDACKYCHTTGDFGAYTCTECHIGF